MKFRTVFQASPSTIRLSIRKPVLFCGSCFSDYICSRMNKTLWLSHNLGGTLFNPISIAYAVKILLLETDENVIDRMIRDSLIEHDGVWHSLLFDSSCSDLSKQEVVRKIRQRRENALEMMRHNANLIFTFGTAWTFALIADVAGMEGKVVGNCHKLPAYLFERRLLTSDEVVDEWKEIAEALRQRWPEIKIIFTLSPVRHIKDGLDGNSLSKSILRLSINQLISDLKKKYPAFVDYFPAYEIMVDDLRDYRFYQADLVHPSDMAVDYIWEKFLETYVPQEERKCLDSAEKIVKGLSHKSIISNPRQDTYRKENIYRQYSSLKEIWPQASEI